MTLNDYYESAVRDILTHATTQLVDDPTRRFVYVEIGFFQLWWREQDAETKAVVARLVADGQLEFTNGGWCMSDEATVHYSDDIDQMTLGHTWLHANFGRCCPCAP